jgi:hypothetical protein
VVQPSREQDHENPAKGEVTQRIHSRSRVIESDVCPLPHVPSPSSLCPNAVTTTANTPDPTLHSANRPNGPQRHSTTLTTQAGIHCRPPANGRRGRARTCSSDQPRGGFRYDSEGRADNLSWARPNRRIPPHGFGEVPTCDGYSGLYL